MSLEILQYYTVTLHYIYPIIIRWGGNQEAYWMNFSSACMPLVEFHNLQHLVGQSTMSNGYISPITASCLTGPESSILGYIFSHLVFKGTEAREFF